MFHGFCSLYWRKDLLLRLYLAAETSVKKNVEDVMPIATGHEREELEAELEVIALYIYMRFRILSMIQACFPGTLVSSWVSFFR